jgi:serine protease Do
MKNHLKKHLLGYIAVALVFTMAGASLTLLASSGGNASAEQQRLATKIEGTVTSPFTAAIAAVRDSVVGVSNYTTYNYGGFGRFGGFDFTFPGQDQNGGNGGSQETLQATGSGVVISADGYVLTNYHVVEGSTSVKITTPQQTYDAEVITYDKNLDIAILQAKDLKLNPVSLGDSDTLQVGDWAIAIGNPLGTELAGTTTVGIVSALNRQVASESTDAYGIRNTNTMIQVDAAINSGNSGGGMFNVLGELMGIPTLKYSGNLFSGTSVEGIGMCIPINAAKPLIESALSGKAKGDQSGSNPTSENPRPRLGVTVAGIDQNNNSAVAAGKLPAGVYVSQVEDNSPAKTAGIQADDIIVEIDGQRMITTDEMITYLSTKKEGDVVKVKVYRVPGIQNFNSVDEIPKGDYVDFDVTLAILDKVAQ